MKLFDIFKKNKKEDELPEEAKRWNKFIEDVCYRDVETLSQIQKNAVLCFWYDAEMQNGGHCGYFDCYPDTIPEELSNAILEVSYKEIADNYTKALTDGENDDWEETDNAYYNFVPSLCDCLEKYVEKYKDIIFD